MKEDHLWMNWYLVHIRDADVVKFIVLLDLTFFGIIARPAADWDTLKDVFRIIPYRNNKTLV
jgi:hypothetical protein